MNVVCALRDVKWRRTNRLGQRIDFNWWKSRMKFVSGRFVRDRRALYVYSSSASVRACVCVCVCACVRSREYYARPMNVFVCECVYESACAHSNHVAYMERLVCTNARTHWRVFHTHTHENDHCKRVSANPMLVQYAACLSVAGVYRLWMRLYFFRLVACTTEIYSLFFLFVLSFVCRSLSSLYHLLGELCSPLHIMCNVFAIYALPPWQYRYIYIHIRTHWRVLAFIYGCECVRVWAAVCNFPLMVCSNVRIIWIFKRIANDHPALIYCRAGSITNIVHRYCLPFYSFFFFENAKKMSSADFCRTLPVQRVVITPSMVVCTHMLPFLFYFLCKFFTPLANGADRNYYMPVQGKQNAYYFTLHRWTDGMFRWVFLFRVRKRSYLTGCSVWNVENCCNYHNCPMVIK